MDTFLLNLVVWSAKAKVAQERDVTVPPTPTSGPDVQGWANDAQLHETGKLNLSCFWKGTLGDVAHLSAEWEHSGNDSWDTVTLPVRLEGDVAVSTYSFLYDQLMPNLGEHKCTLFRNQTRILAPLSVFFYAAPFLDFQADRTLRLGPEEFESADISDAKDADSLQYFKNDRSQKVPVGSTVRIPCPIPAFPAAAPLWFKRDETDPKALTPITLSNSGQFSTLSAEEGSESGECVHHCLVVRNVSYENAGLYACVAKSSFTVRGAWDAASGAPSPSAEVVSGGVRVDARLRVGGGPWSGLLWPGLGIAAELIATAVVIAASEWNRRRREAKEEEEEMEIDD